MSNLQNDMYAEMLYENAPAVTFQVACLAKDVSKQLELVFAKSLELK